MLSQNDLLAGGLFGVKVADKRGMKVIEPSRGTRVVSALVELGEVQDEATFNLLMKHLGVSGPGAEFMKSRKMLIRDINSDNPNEFYLQDRIDGITYDNLSEYADTEECFGPLVENQPEYIDEKPLVYKLHNVFSDTTLRDRLQLSEQRIQLAKRTAVHDPARAASDLAEYLRGHGFPNCKVVAGDYAKTDHNAANTIRQMAKNVTYSDGCAEANVTHDWLVITFDGFELKKPQWYVRGPLKYAVEINAIYQMAIKLGPNQVIQLLGYETLRLGIEIHDAETQDCYQGKIVGYSNMSGISVGSNALPSGLTSDEIMRLVSASKKVHPVYAENKVVGSAVQVSDRHIIFNSHTLDAASTNDALLTINKAKVHDVKSVAADICVMRTPFTSASWVLREPVVGEKVVLCFNTGVHAEYSEVLNVRGCDAERIVLSESNVVRKGASGAAVIALRDSALLGIFSAKQGVNVICASFRSHEFSTVTDSDTIAATSEYAMTPSASIGDRTYERMVKRGLREFLLEIDAACMPLYVRKRERTEHVGLVARVCDEWVTTVNPDEAQLMLEDGTQLTFRKDVRGYVVVEPPPVLKALPNVRLARPGERVFVFTKAADGQVVMSDVRSITHVLAGVNRFDVQDFGSFSDTMTGALIVAEKDAAVLGQFVEKKSDAYGDASVLCVSLQSTVAGFVDSAAEVRAVIDEMREWQSGSPATIKELAAVGRNAIRHAGAHYGHSRGMPVSQGSAVVVASWDERYEVLLNSLGWLISDWLSFVNHDKRDVAEAFVALQSFRSPGVFVLHLASKLTSGTIADQTPVTGTFPFPLVVGSRSVSPGVGLGLTSSDDRLLALEAKLESMMAERSVSRLSN